MQLNLLQTSGYIFSSFSIISIKKFIDIYMATGTSRRHRIHPLTQQCQRCGSQIVKTQSFNHGAIAQLAIQNISTGIADREIGITPIKLCLSFQHAQ